MSDQRFGLRSRKSSATLCFVSVACGKASPALRQQKSQDWQNLAEHRLRSCVRTATVVPVRLFGSKLLHSQLDYPRRESNENCRYAEDDRRLDQLELPEPVSNHACCLIDHDGLVRSP